MAMKRYPTSLIIRIESNAIKVIKYLYMPTKKAKIWKTHNVKL